VSFEAPALGRALVNHSLKISVRHLQLYKLTATLVAPDARLDAPLVIADCGNEIIVVGERFATALGKIPSVRSAGR
jgi:hypothetical protein